MSDTLYDEQLVLAALLAFPHENAWELSGLDASLFLTPTHRAIATAIVKVRNSGQRFHWKRVRRVLGRRHPAAAFVEPLMTAIGTSCGMTAAISRMHARRARRAA
jgi:hypothetical protein